MKGSIVFLAAIKRRAPNVAKAGLWSRQFIPMSTIVCELHRRKFWPGTFRHSLQGRRRGYCDWQRRGIWPCCWYLDTEYSTGDRAAEKIASWNSLGQYVSCGQLHGAVRRIQAVRFGTRERAGGNSGIYANEDCLVVYLRRGAQPVYHALTWRCPKPGNGAPTRQSG